MNEDEIKGFYQGICWSIAFCLNHQNEGVGEELIKESGITTKLMMEYDVAEEDMKVIQESLSKFVQRCNRDLTSPYAKRYLDKVKAELKDTDKLEYITPSIRNIREIQYVYQDTITGKRYCCFLDENGD